MTIRDPNKHKEISARLNKTKHFFSLKRFSYHLPGILQEWQRQQPSTVIYKDPVKLSVVPPLEEG